MREEPQTGDDLIFTNGARRRYLPTGRGGRVDYRVRLTVPTIDT